MAHIDSSRIVMDQPDGTDHASATHVNGASARADQTHYAQPRRARFISLSPVDLGSNRHDGLKPYQFFITWDLIERANAPNAGKAISPTLGRSRHSLAILTCTLILWISAAPLGHAQFLPATPLRATLTPTTAPALNQSNSPAPQASERTASDIDAQQQEMQTRLAASQADLVKAQNGFKELGSLDPAAQTSAKEHLEDLAHQSDAYAQIIDNLKNLRRLSNKLENARKDKLAWMPPSGSAPWPLAIADDLQFEIMRGQAQIQHLIQRRGIIDEQLSELKKSRISVEAELRQSGQRPLAVAAVSTQTNKVQSANERRLARINLELINFSIDSDALLIEQTTATLLLASLKQTWSFYEHRFSFSTDDFKKIRAGIEKAI